MILEDGIFVDVIENDTNSVVITDVDGIILYVNKRFCELTGYPKSEAIGKHTRFLKSGETLKETYDDLWKTITSGRMWRGEFHNKKRNGVFFWEDATIFPLYTTDKKEISGYIAIKSDITDKVVMMQSIAEKSKFIDKITSTNPNVVYIYDIINKKNIYINTQITNLTGYTPSEINSFDNNLFKYVVHKDDIEALEKYYDDIKRQVNGSVYEIEHRLIHRNGAIKWVLSRDSIFEFEGSMPKLVVGTMIDITDRKNYEQGLIESNSTKDKLFSVISHDLKSPFGALMGYIELLYSDIEELDKNEIKDFTNDIYQISKQINTLLINLLDWSQLQTNRLVVTKIKINLLDFINYIFELLKIIADRKEINMVAEIQPNLNVYVDEKMLYSILYNLVYNAIKFTPKDGTITITASKGNFIDDDRINISVLDTGIGMTYENMGKLFVLDGQYTTIGTNNERGSGLGLLIVKEFVEKMGGKIEVKSELGKGTEFIFDAELYDS